MDRKSYRPVKLKILVSTQWFEVWAAEVASDTAASPRKRLLFTEVETSLWAHCNFVKACNLEQKVTNPAVSRPMAKSRFSVYKSNITNSIGLQSDKVISIIRFLIYVYYNFMKYSVIPTTALFITTCDFSHQYHYISGSLEHSGHCHTETALRNRLNRNW